MGTTWRLGGGAQRAKRRQPSRTRRWLPRTGTLDALEGGGRGSPRSGQDSRAGQGAPGGHSENVLRPWTDQVAARGSPVTVDRGQPSRPGARRLPGPSAAPAPLGWPRAPLASRCMCVAVSWAPPALLPLPPALSSRFLSSTKPYGSS